MEEKIWKQPLNQKSDRRKMNYSEIKREKERQEVINKEKVNKDVINYVNI